MDRNPALEAAIGAAGHLALIGDATDERALQEAGIERAAALIAAAAEDATNLVVTLTPRALCPELRIISRVNEGDWQDRIIRAGANVAQSPYPSYGTSLAVSAVTPGVVELHTLPLLGLATEEIEVSSSSGLVGRSIPEVSEMMRGVLIIGLRRAKEFHRWDDVAGSIAPGDVVVALGDPTMLRTLAQLRYERGRRTHTLAMEIRSHSTATTRAASSPPPSSSTSRRNHAPFAVFSKTDVTTSSWPTKTAVRSAS